MRAAETLPHIFGKKSQRGRTVKVGSEPTSIVISPSGQQLYVANSSDGTVSSILTKSFTAVEVPDRDRVPLLRAYLKRWKWEVGAFFGGVGPGASDEELACIARDHPVFRIVEPT